MTKQASLRNLMLCGIDNIGENARSEIPLTTLADLAANVSAEVDKVLQTPQAAEFGARGVLAIGGDSHCGEALGMPPADSPFP